MAAVLDATLAEWSQRVRAAAAAATPLAIRAGGTKDFYGNAPRGEPFDPRAFAGIVAYEPTELVVTARCGTPLAQLEDTLEASGQMLAFEPPHFGATATVGGCVAAGLSGPRRAAAGAVRDFVLGAKLLDGRGQLLSFGGTVMKNVAGYDVSRALAGSLGTLGIIAEVSLKVLPRPRVEQTLRLELDERTALARLNELAGQPLPVSASAWHAGVLHVRLSGSEPAVAGARTRIGGEPLAMPRAAGLWRGVREHTDAFFAFNAPLWRLSLPSTAEPVGIEAEVQHQMIEWGGALRWLRSFADPQVIRRRAAELGGSATLFRGGDRSLGVFAPLSPGVLAIHQRLKAEFDPAGVFNPGRMYAGV
jgi:glycolate oxidase FAD binding subunit